MFKVNTEDLSIYVNRGDALIFDVEATNQDGEPYIFKRDDVLRFRVYKKKRADDVIIQKDFKVASANQTIVQIYLSKEETKRFDFTSKPVEYWYEVEFNPDNEPQTIVGYDDDGAKIFKLFPEGADIDEPETSADAMIATEGGKT